MELPNKCNECVTYVICRSKLINYLDDNYYIAPYNYMEVYRAYYHELRPKCKFIYEKYRQLQGKHIIFKCKDLSIMILNEFSLGRLKDEL